MIVAYNIYCRSEDDALQCITIILLFMVAVVAVWELPVFFQIYFNCRSNMYMYAIIEVFVTWS